jgi:3-dehydroquinate dehydratase-2
MTDKPLLFIHGPNLNMLGRREPEIYGSQTLADLEDICREACDKAGLKTDFFQSNHEGEIVERIQQAMDNACGLIINAGAYTHTSVAIHDALKLLSCPIGEVHLSNPKEREEFRHHSYITPVAAFVIAGQGAQGYIQAIEKIEKLIQRKTI